MGRGAGSPRRVTHRAVARRPQTETRASRWTDARLEAELQAFTDGLTTFPTRREFDRAGRADLRCAVAKHGGPDRWAARLGLTLAPSQVAHRPYEEHEAVADARRVIEMVGKLPGTAKLRRMGYGRLATAVKHARGAKRFRRLHGLD